MGAGARLFGEYCFVIVLGVIKVCFPVVFETAGKHAFFMYEVQRGKCSAEEDRRLY